MSGDYTGNSHPARKVDQEELKQVLAEMRDDVPAVTKRMVANEYQKASPQAVKDNLDSLAEAEEICKVNDGDVLLYWYPREQDEPGVKPYSEIVDDSIDYDEINPEDVPKQVAEDIAAERLPFYRPRSFWSEVVDFSQLALLFSFGMTILGIGELVSNNLGLGEEIASHILVMGFSLALLSVILYATAMLLDFLASKDYVSSNPLPKLEGLLR